MTKNSKQKPLLITVFLMILLIYSIHANLVTNVHAAEPSVQDKTLSILSDVVGLKAELYTTSQSSERDNQYVSLAQKEADLNLVSSQSEFRVICSFVNDKLRKIYMCDYEGDLLVKQPATNTVEMAKGFLQRYQNYAADSFYGELASMLDNVDPKLNATKSAGNIKLDVSNSNQKLVSYKWTYTDENGVIAKRKSVILNYETGRLRGFYNNWPFYTVVGTPEISAEEATAIALEASKNFSYQVTTTNGTIETISGFNIAPKSLGHAVLSYLNFQDQISARGGDPFTLYPSWYVPLGFDKFYPGDVSGMTVSIWADTGEISIMGEVVVDSGLASSIEQETNVVQEIEIAQGFNQESTTLSAPVVVAVIFGVVGVSLGTSKKAFKLTGGKKLFSKYWAMLLCASILFSVMLVATPEVSADIPTPNSKSRIYACLWGDGYFNFTIDSAEASASVEIGNEIEDYFNDDGYSTSNDMGSGTTRTNVMSHASSDEANYHRTAVFHVGHQSTTGYQDNYGTQISPYDIYSHTYNGLHFFVFIWVCEQAIDPTTNTMPRAWTHRDNEPGRPYLSADGYADPDGHGQCYIGFQGFSPMVSSLFQTFQGEDQLNATKDFMKSFYDHAFNEDLSVNQALDEACDDYFVGCNFANSILNTGYSSWWPGGEAFEDKYPLNESGYYPDEFNWYYNPDKPLNHMNVFGDGDIHLKQYDFTVVAKDQYNNEFSNKDVYVDSPYNIANTGATMKVTSGDHTFFVNDFWETDSGECTGYRYYFDYWQPEPGWQIYSNPLEWDVDEDFTMTAYFNKQYCPGDVDGDGDKDSDDLNEFKSVYPAWRGDESYLSTCDFDSDGDVDVTDRVYLYSLFNKATYHMDEGQYSTVHDSSDYGNDGTVYGATWTTGVSSSALSFDGNNDYVNVPDSNSLDIANEVTVEAWIKPSRLNVWQSPLEKGAHEDWAYGFYIEAAGGNIGFEVGLEGQEVDWAGATAAVNSYLEVGKWSHIVGTADSATGKVRLYIDGTQVDEDDFPGEINQNSLPFQVGKRYDGGFFGGVIDEVRIYDRVLSEDEIEDNYEALLPHHQVTVYCWETVYGVQIEEWISIDDGDYYTEYGYLSVSLPEGEHTLEVGTEVAYFMTFYDGSNYFGPNPTTIDVTSEMTIVALYIAY